MFCVKVEIEIEMTRTFAFLFFFASQVRWRDFFYILRSIEMETNIAFSKLLYYCPLLWYASVHGGANHSL